MKKAWSDGREWQIKTLKSPANRGDVTLLTVHDAPYWIAHQMLLAAERFVSPLKLCGEVDLPPGCCRKPDRHEPKLVCGYPLPCPHHPDAD